MISLSGAIWLVVYMLVGAIIFGLLDYLVKTAPFVPEGWKPTIRWMLVALAIFVLIGILLSFSGRGPIFRA